MMNLKIYVWLVAFGMLTSCVDDKYDLGKIDTDGILIGDEWVFPLGTVDVKVTDVIDLDQTKVEGLQIAANGDYSVSYEDYIEIPLSDMPNIPGMPDIVDITDYISIPTTTFEVDDLSNIMGDFGEDFTLGLANPYVLLEADGLKGDGTIDANLRLTASKKTDNTVVVNAPFAISTAKPNVWIGPWTPTDKSYTYVKNEQLPDLIASFPDKIVLEATQFLVPINKIEALKGLTYKLQLPFIPSDQFKATATQSMDDIFDESMVDYVFSSGSTTISGTIQNQLPFDAEIVMSITDAENEVLIKLPMQKVEGTGARPVSFEITEKEMYKMKNARNIQLEFKLKGRTANKEYLNENQTMKMELKLRKKGGIKVEA